MFVKTRESVPELPSTPLGRKLSKQIDQVMANRLDEIREGRMDPTLDTVLDFMWYQTVKRGKGL